MAKENQDQPTASEKANAELIDALKKQNSEQAEKIKSLTEELSVSNKNLESAQDELKTATALIDELTQENSALAEKKSQPASNALPVVKSNGKEYQFMAAAFRLGQKVITAQEAAADQEMIDELVADGFGLLKQIN